MFKHLVSLMTALGQSKIMSSLASIRKKSPARSFNQTYQSNPYSEVDHRRCLNKKEDYYADGQSIVSLDPSGCVTEYQYNEHKKKIATLQDKIDKP